MFRGRAELRLDHEHHRQLDSQNCFFPSSLSLSLFNFSERKKLNPLLKYYRLDNLASALVNEIRAVDNVIWKSAEVRKEQSAKLAQVIQLLFQ